MATIIPFLKDAASFDQTDITAMSMALEDVCNTLKLGADKTVRETVATRIIELARRGERDPIKLRSRLLQEANGSIGC